MRKTCFHVFSGLLMHFPRLFDLLMNDWIHRLRLCSLSISPFTDDCDQFDVLRVPIHLFKAKEFVISLLYSERRCIEWNQTTVRYVIDNLMTTWMDDQDILIALIGRFCRYIVAQLSVLDNSDQVISLDFEKIPEATIIRAFHVEKNANNEFDTTFKQTGKMFQCFRSMRSHFTYILTISPCISPVFLTHEFIFSVLFSWRDVLHR